MNIIKQIFKDHFYQLAAININIRHTVFENVDRILHCGDYNYGFAVYGCEHCGKLRAVPFIFAFLRCFFAPSFLCAFFCSVSIIPLFPFSTLYAISYAIIKNTLSTN